MGGTEMNRNTLEINAKNAGYICRGIAVFVILLIIAYIILGYVVAFEGSDGEIRDGLNRLLDDIPGAMNMILPQWAGYIWLVIDLLVILALSLLTDLLFRRANTYLHGVKNVDF